jgi:hypothetical protein
MSVDEPVEREYFRTTARLSVKLGPDTEEGRRAMALDAELWQVQSELETKASRVFQDIPVSEEVVPLLDVMRWLDYKLDLVLYHLRGRELDRFFPHQAVTTDVSGSGLGLTETLPFEPADKVLISLSLPSAPARPLYICGDVVRRGEKEAGPGAGLAIRFLEINELDRERLIRFNFRQQRRALAKKWSEDEP